MPTCSPIRIVLTPDAFGLALLHDEEGRVLSLWRDGLIQPVVNRCWLVRCLRLMHRLGLPDRLIRRWGWWLGSAARCHATTDPPSGHSGLELYEHLAQTSSASYIVYGRPRNPGIPGMPVSGSGASWISLSELLNRLSPMDASSTDLCQGGKAIEDFSASPIAKRHVQDGGA
jgi:hypothetical protein